MSQGEAAETARNAGADYVGSGELIEKVRWVGVQFLTQSGWNIKNRCK